MDRVAVDTRVSVLTNTLVVVVPATSRIRDWTAADTIAIAEPSSVPAGVYAKKWLVSTGRWNSLESKLIPTENVRGALAAVTSGNADAAIVYRSDVSPRVKIVEEAPDLGISYPFAVLKNAPNKEEARRFLAYLQSNKAMEVFARWNAGVPPAVSQASRRRELTAKNPAGETPAGRPAGRWRSLTLTLQTAALSTLLLLPPGLGVAWLLARFRWRGKSVLETLVALPLVMPPVATGLILLHLVSPFEGIVFTWRAVVLAMLVMSFPLFVRAARLAFEGVDPRLEQIARTLGASDTRVFFTITLPLATRGIVSGMLLAFARAVGEFGATILVAGNIPGRTRTLSLAIYNDVQLGHDADAFRLLAISVVIAFAAVWIAEAVLRKSHEPHRS